MKGQHSYNLWRHVQRKHKEIAKLLEPEVKRFQSYFNRNDDGETFVVKFNKNELIKSCVELVTINGRALTLVNDSGFRRLLSPVYDALKDNGKPFVITQQRIREYSDIEQKQIENKISEEMKNKIVSLKLDIVTTMGRYAEQFSFLFYASS